MPIDYKLYAENWLSEIRPAILQRAGNRCEFCGVPNYTYHPETGSRVVLTIAHLNHDIHDNRPENLAALCQKCHNTHDGHKRGQSRIRHRRKKLEDNGQSMIEF